MTPTEKKAVIVKAVEATNVAITIGGWLLFNRIGKQCGLSSFRSQYIAGTTGTLDIIRQKKTAEASYVLRTTRAWIGLFVINYLICAIANKLYAKYSREENETTPAAGTCPIKETTGGFTNSHPSSFF